MRVHGILVGAYEVNCYVVFDDDRQAIIVDPGADADLVVRCIEQERLTVKAYLLTHGHTDHVSALADVADAYPAPVGMHPLDAAWAFSSANALRPYYDAPRHPGSIARPLRDGQDWTDGGLHYRILATPGHTPGGVCLHFPEAQVVFTGDTLFAGSVGRTDLPGGDDAQLNASLRLLAALPEATTVFAGHGPKTTIGQEKVTNPYIRYRP